MNTETNPTLRKAHKILKKIVKKLGNPDLNFSVQISTDSSRPDAVIVYSAMINSPKEGIAPITFADFTKEGFLEKLKNFYENKIDETSLEIAFHEAQIVLNDRNTEYHQSKIEQLKNPKDEEELNPDEDEVREHGEK